MREQNSLAYFHAQESTHELPMRSPLGPNKAYFRDRKGFSGC